MTFNSLQFAAFFLVVVVAYWRLDRRGQNLLVVVAGSVFYGAFDVRFLGLLYLSIAVDFTVARAIEASDVARRRKQLLAVSLAVQLGMLGTFKYADFFTDSAASFLDRLGLSIDPPVLGLLLPVGISFYTFQTLAYVIAVYRKHMKAEQNVVTFAAFVAWFPQMVAGPIERPQSLLPQIQRRREPPTPELLESAVVLIARGLFKKVVIADGVASYVGTVFSNPAGYGWFPLALGSVAFALQVYGDFSGYSDMARGLSRLLGIELRWNFEQPFLSRNTAELWQRWHTSLGWWFTWHVARPLGAARGGKLRAAGVTLLIFALIGLWHGAAWTFVAWGILNGLLVARQRLWPSRPTSPTRIDPLEIPAILGTFTAFCVTAVFFRSASIGDAGSYLRRVVTFQDGTLTAPNALIVVVAAAATLALDLSERRARVRASEQLGKPISLGGVSTPEVAAKESGALPTNPVGLGLAIGAIACGIVVFSGGDPIPFIYFSF
jgi:D-alanyl-lipoteichoic acid acyltransferase DltB (MBOAT superfamily)